jgi:hypothetical protein
VSRVNQRETLGDRLRHQGAIERVVMVARQITTLTERDLVQEA